MAHLLVTSILSLLSLAVAGQESGHAKSRPSVKEGARLDLRAKVITFVIIEDTYFTTANLGVELIHNSHSIGIDGSYFRWRFENDDVDDVAMYQRYERRTYLLFDYKYRFLNRGQNQVYLNSYVKTGTYKMWYAQLDHALSAMDSIETQNRSDGTFNELGAGLGYKRNFKGSSCGYDISANVAKRFSTTDNLIYSTVVTSELEDDARTTELVFYMRLNFFFPLARFRNPEQRTPSR